MKAEGDNDERKISDTELFILRRYTFILPPSAFILALPMRLIFMGTPEAAVPTLRRCLEDDHEVVAVWTQPDRPAGRGHKLKAPPVKEFAQLIGLAVHQPTKIRTDEAFSL